VARDLWARAGIGPSDVDVAMLYDHFSGMVLLQLEDYGFCAPGEGGPFFAETTLPINTHGGSLSEAYIHGLNHVVEGVRQLRGESTTPVPGAETCLVTSAAGVPGSALVLRRAR
jgi:acetyl-CoA acetyltransferase